MTLEDSVHRHRAAILHRAALLDSVTQACQEAGISRTLIYRWRRRYLRSGADGLRPRPTRPFRWPRQAIPALEHAVLAYALLWPTQGPARIALQLRQPLWGGWRVTARASTRSSGGTACRLGGSGSRGWSPRSDRRLLTERTRRRLVRPHVEAQRPGDLVCLDAFYIGKLKGVSKVWQRTACDAACSYGIATLVPRVTQQTAIQFLRAHGVPAYARAGHRIRAVLTDGGPEWQARFVAACRELGISHRRTRPRHAWTNGFVERLQGTILTELQDLQAYLRFYNRTGPIRATDSTAARRPWFSWPRKPADNNRGRRWRINVSRPRPHWTR